MHRSDECLKILNNTYTEITKYQILYIPGLYQLSQFCLKFLHAKRTPAVISSGKTHDLLSCG